MAPLTRPDLEKHMTSNAKRHLLAEIARALGGLPDDVGPQVLEFLRSLGSRSQVAGAPPAVPNATPANWSTVAGTLRWPGDPLAFQQQLRAEWQDSESAGDAS